MQASNKLDDKSITERLSKLANWQHCENAIQKEFTFADFREAFEFMQKVAEFAEAQQHHPDWCNCYNRVTITLSTHDAGGLSEKDFILAQCIDDTFKQQSG